MAKKTVEKIFAAKSLVSPGGQIYRTISSLPEYISVEELVQYAVDNGYGYRIENGIIRLFSPS